MTMKYLSQLTDDELKDLLTCLVTNYCEGTDFNCYYIEHNYYLVTVEGAFNTVTIDGVKYSDSIKFELDDYHVYNSHFEFNEAMTKDYRKHMFNKFEKQYAYDCFWDGCEG